MGVGARLSTSAPVFALLIKLDDSTPLQMGLITIPSENPAKIDVKLARPMRLQSSKEKFTVFKLTNRISTFQPLSKN